MWSSTSDIETLDGFKEVGQITILMAREELHI